MNQFVLQGQDVRVQFNDTDGPLLKKSFSYQDAQRQVVARGEEISEMSTPLGRQVTITLEESADGSKLLFTLLTPRLGIKQAGQPVECRTLGVHTHRGVPRGPPAAGQFDTYESVPMVGKMTMLAEGAKTSPQEREALQESSEASTPDGFSPERFELKGEDAEIELDLDITTGKPKRLHYKDPSREVNADEQEIRWIEAEFGQLVSLTIERISRTGDPGMTFFTLLVPRTSPAAVQPISTKAFRTSSRVSASSVGRGQLQTYEVVNLEGRAIVFVRQQTEESASPIEPS